jgi:hypothetical protein
MNTRKDNRNGMREKGEMSASRQDFILGIKILREV